MPLNKQTNIFVTRDLEGIKYIGKQSESEIYIIVFSFITMEKNYE